MGQEQLGIQREYYEVDEEDMPILKDESSKDLNGYQETMKDFVREKVVVDSGDSQVMIKSVKKIFRRN